MTDIVETLVFSIVMLIFMAYPAMVVATKIADRFSLSQKSQAILTVAFTIIFSLAVGIFLKLYWNQFICSLNFTTSPTTIITGVESPLDFW